MKINALHYITTNAEAAELACRGGVRWVQLRVKNQPPAIWKQLALDTQAVCRRHGATLIINDNPALAQEIGADGVHLGKEDLPPDEAREMLGSKFIIGGTANTFADVQRLAAAGVNYVGLGPFRFTSTKEKLSPILGLAGYTEIMRQCQAMGITAPVIGIGGITLADVPALLAAGLHGVAVSGAIGATENPADAAGLFVSELSAVNAI
ncbi:thiamine phosphate synthase [Hymenobacter properus]|uniref:Thiamine-phosphate synthase n=1 Tax=Hymenobacter properus TaxID=2791026 RepID=A0A931BFC7_9BACT|nr:thiamine phosphate synthase [Hymenobacter properus]MBF9141428.1 thiamine phosphate synthase [Hymenobacter properus]MBR7720237.1 thiamine phosphate synthase [Microvirga sp. SRT04]